MSNKFDSSISNAVSNFVNECVMNNFIDFVRKFNKKEIYFLMSFPRSGNGWIRYMITEALLISKGIELSDSRRGTYKHNKIEAHCIITKSGQSFGIEDIFPDYYAINKDNLQNKYFDQVNINLENIYIKTHHIVSRKDVKVVHLYRNPKDTCISLFNFFYINNAFYHDQLNILDFTSYFKKNIKFYLDVYYKILGYYFDKSKNKYKNILLVSMEDMLRNSTETFSYLLKFLKININENEKVEILKRNPKLQSVNKETWFKLEKLWDEELDSYNSKCLCTYLGRDN